MIDMLWYDIWCDKNILIWYLMIWYDIIGLIWFDMVWYDMISSDTF